MQTGIINEKVQQAIQILNEKNIDMWLTFVRESSNIHDPALDMIAGTNLTWHSALILNKNGETAAIVGDMEKENIQKCGAYSMVIGYTQAIREILVDYIKEKSPAQIALNFSLDSNLADGLTHGMFITLNDYLKDSGYEKKFISSEEIVAALKGRKSPSEVAIMKEAIKETLRIFNEVTGFISPGKTEKDIAAFVLKLVKERGLEVAWDEDHCPAVFTGPDPASAHSGPTDRVIEKGHMINMDLGVKVNGYCADRQRTWYVLRDDEDKAPAEVQRGYNVIRDAIQKVADAIKPGVTGVDMDSIA